LSGEASDRPLEGRPGNNKKKSAHRVVELGSNAEPGEAICDPADRYAPKIPLSDATARGVPAADDYIEALFFDGAEHSRERRLVASMTAKYGALLASIPSMTAVDKPRRPSRWTQRMRELACARLRTL
jgi:hypothetical protein